MSSPAASVIVALNPHEGAIDPVLDGYRRQVPVDGGFELNVVDNGSRGDLQRSRFDDAEGLRVRWVETQRPGRAAANNAGVRAARGATLIFVADDFIPAPTLVRAHVEFHRHLARVGVGIGPAFFTPECRADAFRRWLEDSGRLFGVPFRTAASKWPRDFLYLGNASMPRELHQALGGFDEAFEHDLFDDLEFSLRLVGQGVVTHLVPKALAWHDHAVTVHERLQAMRRSGDAARGYDDTRPARGPWSALADQSIDALAARVARGCDEQAGAARRFDYFSALVDLAFVCGYRRIPEPPSDG